MQQNKAFDDWLASTALGGANQSYIEELYESYLGDPQSVEESWRATEGRKEGVKLVVYKSSRQVLYTLCSKSCICLTFAIQFP